MISYLLAKVTALFIAGYFPDAVITTTVSKKTEIDVVGKKVEDVDVGVILKRNFFDDKETKITKDVTVTDTIPDKVVKVDIPKTDKAVETTLDIKLISTISVGNGENPYSSCVIKSARKTGTYTIKSKESFAPNTKIVRILHKRVEFLNNDKLEFVKLLDFAKAKDFTKKPVRDKKDVKKRITRKDDTPTEIKQEGDVIKIPRTEVNKALANLSKLYTDIRAVPYFKDGKAQGLKLLSVKRGSLFSKLGLRRGDILKSINGKVLDIQSGLQMFNELKNESEFTLELDRRGEEKKMKYEII